MSEPHVFEVTYLGVRQDKAGNMYGIVGGLDATIAFDHHAGVSAFGAGALTIEHERLVLAGQRRVRSARVMAAGGAMGIAVGFLVALMWQAERWPPVMIAVLAVLVVGCVLLFTRTRRIEPFRWEVPWREVVSFSENNDTALEWLVSVKGTHLGTLGFSVLGGRGGELVDRLVDVQARGLTKVTFLEREVPEARMVHRHRE